MEAKDWAVVFATLAGPILAIQAQKWIERAQAAKRRQEQIFETLLRTFSTRLDAQHVQALNMIEVAFRPYKSFVPFSRTATSAGKVIEAWRLYAGHLNTNISSFTPADHSTHLKSSDNLFKALMYEISAALGYGITKDVIARGAYYPQGSVDLEQKQRLLLENVTSVFSGEKSLPMDVRTFPVSEEAQKSQIALNLALADALKRGSFPSK